VLIKLSSGNCIDGIIRQEHMAVIMEVRAELKLCYKLGQHQHQHTYIFPCKQDMTMQNPCGFKQRPLFASHSHLQA